ncbi:MAG TPA: hypothetical protein VL899_10115 [Alphaproteobacteria bacterium]|jgi:hypothetical protein|nr:hypothetical protein [Alphaproteobacteria bacterium]
MVIKNRNSEAIFSIFSRDDSSYAIEVVIPESNPTTVTGFASREAAEGWIASYKERLEAAEARGNRPFRARAKQA